jgi:hypothetical protein
MAEKASKTGGEIVKPLVFGFKNELWTNPQVTHSLLAVALSLPFVPSRRPFSSLTSLSLFSIPAVSFKD